MGKPAISRFFADTLRAPLANVRWSWGSYSPQFDALFLRVWQSELSAEENAVLVFKDRAHDRRLGQSERNRHRQQMLNGQRAFGILCLAENPRSEQRRIKNYDSETLVQLGTPFQTGAENWWYAPILRRIDVSDR